jgi:hypothetical protein
MPTLRIAALAPLTLFIILLFSIFSCSKDAPVIDIPETDMTTEEESQDNTDSSSDDDPMPTNDPTSGSDSDSDNNSNSCSNPADFIYNEENGIVLVEFENTIFGDSWSKQSSSGVDYLVWQGDQYFNQPGNGLLTYNIKINNPGTYRFHWYNAIMIGSDGTEHNDSWLRFNDADDFYGQKGNSVVYPRDTGKSPNPAGSSKDGWFKIYRSGGTEFKWSTRTSDHNAHEIYLRFDSAGVYKMEVSARSSGHAIDKFILFKDNWSEADATNAKNFSTVTCN